jgi:hypothetical protein
VLPSSGPICKYMLTYIWQTCNRIARQHISVPQDPQINHIITLKYRNSAWQFGRKCDCIFYVCLQAQSVCLVASEKKKLAKSTLFLGIASLKLFIHILMDYCLYWVLATIQRHGRVQITVEGRSMFCSH